MFSNLYVRGIKIKQIEEDAYYKNLPAIKHIMDMGELSFNSNVTFLVGENGIGKSTLIEAIAVASGDGIKSISYKDTEHYIVTKRFMDAPEKMLEDLFE